MFSPRHRFNGRYQAGRVQSILPIDDQRTLTQIQTHSTHATIGLTLDVESIAGPRFELSCGLFIYLTARDFTWQSGPGYAQDNIRHISDIMQQSFFLIILKVIQISNKCSTFRCIRFFEGVRYMTLHRILHDTWYYIILHRDKTYTSNIFDVYLCLVPMECHVTNALEKANTAKRRAFICYFHYFKNN